MRMLGRETHRRIHECEYGCCTLVAPSDRKGRRMLVRMTKRAEKAAWRKEEL